MSERAPKASDASVVMGKGDLDAIGKARALAPTVTDLAAGTKREVRIEPHPQTGRPQTVATVPLREAIEAMRPKWRAETNATNEMDARQDKETLVGRDGKSRKVLSSIARNVAIKTGARSVQRVRATSVYRDGKWWTRRGSEWVEQEPKCMTRPLLEGDDRTAPAGWVH